MWGELMQRVPGSTIIIQNDQLDPPDNRRYMIDRFRRLGIGPDRLKLRPGTNRAGVLKAYGEVDISLDTWPYCGGNTIAESLWQGVPVVTLRGENFTSRYGASLLLAAGCGELIANTREEYIGIAARLAQAPARLQYLRHNLRRIYTEGGLNDSAKFARKLERAYMHMMDVRAGRATPPRSGDGQEGGCRGMTTGL
jgi:predicted O-linked N-acetylglucosamine transferase (SPINDLY family)